MWIDFFELIGECLIKIDYFKAIVAGSTFLGELYLIYCGELD